jgi:hypothetical protein
MKKVYIFCLAVLCSLSSNAQLGVTTYNATTPFSQGFSRVVGTSDGGFLVVGSTGINGRISKLNSAYVTVWSFQMDSLPLNDVVETNDGNYVVQGFTYKTDYPLGAVYVVKFTPSGTIMYQKMFYDPANVSAVTSSGIAKGAGADNGYLLFGGNCIAMNYVLKCDASGVIQWQYSYAPTFGAGTTFSVIPESNGYVAALTTAVNSVQSAAILKLDASGVPVGARTLQSTNGVTMFPNNLTHLNNGDYFLWTAPYDIYGAQNYTISSSLSTITCNRVANSSIEITGAFASGNTNDEVMMTFIGHNTFYGGVLKVTPSGTIAMQKYSSDVNNLVYPSDGLSMHNGNYVLAGTVNNNRGMIAVVDETAAGFCSSQNPGCTAQQNYPFTTGSPTVTSFPITIAQLTVNYPTTAITYATVNVCGTLIGVEENDFTDAGISVYPNPFSNSVSIERKTNDLVTVNVIDATGRIVLSKQTSGTKIEIGTAELANGIYSLQLIDAEGIKILKVVKN